MPLKQKGFTEFGQFRFDREERTLWRDGHVVPLTPKATDTLAALLESPGRLMEKDELIRTIWPDTFVEEGNLTFQISQLRKLFGEDGYIETVPRRGYRFVAEVRQAQAIEVSDLKRELEVRQPVQEISLVPGSEGTASPLPEISIASHAPVSRRWLLGAGAAGLGAAGVLLWSFSHRQTLGKWNITSIAVLPFQILPETQPERQAFALGLADAVTMRLGAAPQIIVRPTSAVRQFDQAARDPLAAGLKLGVDAILDASVHSSQGRLRVNAQLLRTRDGRILWSETFDLADGELFTIEDQLSNRLMHSLLGETLARDVYRPKPEAYRLYNLGVYYRQRWNTEGSRKAIEYAGQAIGVDPGYAAAHALMAQSWSQIAYFFGQQPRVAYPKAEEAAQMALGLDEKLPEGHHVLGATAFFYHWNIPLAEKHLRRSVELNPNGADSLHFLGLVRTVQHQSAEGLSLTQKALDIDPASAWRYVGMTFQYACNGRMEEAIRMARRAHDLDPMLAAPMFDLYNLNMVRGNHREAVEWYGKQLSRPGANAALAASMVEIFEKHGVQAFLEARIARFLEQVNTPSFSPLILAQQYAFLNRKEEAVFWLSKAAEEHQATILFINQHPMYAGLKSHSKFQEIVSRIGL